MRSLQDVALDPVVDRNDVEARLAPPAVASLERPAGLVPLVALGRADGRDEVHPVDARPARRLGAKAVEVEDAVGRMGDDGVGHAGLADQGRQRARVDAGEADHAARLEPGVEPPLGPEIRGFGEVGAHDRADRRRGGGGIDHLDVLVVDADDPDMGEGEGHDLGGVGRIGEDLLVAGHRGVEADFADRRADGADAVALDHVAVGERQHAGDDARTPPRLRSLSEVGPRIVRPCCA